MSGDDSKFDGLGSIINLSGIIPARAKYVTEAFLSATLGSMTIGLTFGMMGSAFLTTGPLIPFLFGSWLGHSFGLYQHYQMGHNETIRVAKLYPSVLAHALMTDHHIIIPPEVVAVSEERLNAKEVEDSSGTNAIGLTPTLDEWIRKGSYRVMAFAILATQDCRPDIEEIERHRRQQLIENYQEKYSVQKTDDDE
jgi:hypothetical protein